MIAVSLMASERYTISTFFDTIIPLRGDSAEYNPAALEHKETEESASGVRLPNLSSPAQE